MDEALKEFQGFRESWWPKKGTVWRNQDGLAVVVCISVSVQAVPEWVITWKDDEDRLWTRPLRSWLRDFAQEG